jgi:DNA-binding response OmpR family regulator
MRNDTRPARAILCGLEPDVAQELRAALGMQDVTAQLCTDVDQALSMSRDGTADVLFCPFSLQLMTLLKAIAVPVVIVSRQPEVNQWLDALEAGAAEYCVGPFEPTQLRWILQSTRRFSAAV